MRLTEALTMPCLIGDGANGTVLAAMGFKFQPTDLANIMAPELVIEVHRQYFDAGADFVETNTFSSNRFKMAGHKVDIAELNLQGARLAREAAGRTKLVLGAIGPAGKSMEPIGQLSPKDIAESITEVAAPLIEGGIDGFILESFINIDELEVAVRALQAVSDLPIIVSKAYIEDGETLAEGFPLRCSERMASWGVAAVGANCVVGPQRMTDLVRMLSEASDLPVLAFPTPGLPQLVKGEIAYDTSPEYFAKASLKLIEEGARIIGGCCGTTPDHIREIRRALDEAPVKVRKRATTTLASGAAKELPTTPPTALREKLGEKFVVAVEVDVPRGLRLEKLFSAVERLRDAGADVINISDGARARLRMNPMAVCHEIQTNLGIDATMHFSCRDRNLLAIQADLLGCHTLGVRNILAVTGDPANIGDYPSATSVFDVDAIGLTRILSRLNEGNDLAGYSVGMKCGFTIAVAFNPMALDFDLEYDRLKRKADAGAHLVYTQPVFDEAMVDKAIECCTKLGLPSFVGVMPLRSHRHTEFMHNEVPGIVIPDWLRKRMADADTDEEAIEAGVEESQKLAAAIRKCAQGLYLMPPAGNLLLAERVMEAAR
ncbi:MAG: bifunctional homocysteine S-methyltransferase/methylenetetrahydrofolate reductase [Fimbriimonadaceae bacterium]|nr:bifunctional homocysteine S-methyltransferase/methylenetetrahydrofolate reductase [Fimbriimonadaceae bacterium]